jgi:hypothetical protein
VGIDRFHLGLALPPGPYVPADPCHIAVHGEAGNDTFSTMIDSGTSQQFLSLYQFRKKSQIARPTSHFDGLSGSERSR